MRPMPELEVREMKVRALVPYANNAKIHTMKQVDQIAVSISEFGNCDPIAVWHLTDEQRRAYTHVHNQTTLSSGFDCEALIEDMDNLNADWESFGFDKYLYKDVTVDAIEDLMTEDFATNVLNGNGETFSFSLMFPIEVKDSVKAYVNAIGKNERSARIIKEAEEWE